MKNIEMSENIGIPLLTTELHSETVVVDKLIIS